jgi:hypothetical protein
MWKDGVLTTWDHICAACQGVELKKKWRAFGEEDGVYGKMDKAARGKGSQCKGSFLT